MGVGRFGGAPRRLREAAAAWWLAPLVAASIAGCARLAPRPSAESAQPSSASPVDSAADDRLPPGRGRAILEAECTGCHNLGGLWAYKGYYNEQRWRSLVQTMIAHGANLDETATNELVDYLVEHFGPGSR